MFVGQGFGGLEFDHELVVQQQVGVEFADDGAVFVEDLDGVLLLHVQPELAEAVGQGVLIDLLQVPVAVIDVDGIRCLADQVAEFVDGFHFFVLFVMAAKERNEIVHNRKAGIW